VGRLSMEMKQDRVIFYGTPTDERLRKIPAEIESLIKGRNETMERLHKAETLVCIDFWTRLRLCLRLPFREWPKDKLVSIGTLSKFGFVKGYLQP
jgi:hypothetical protein